MSTVKTELKPSTVTALVPAYNASGFIQDTLQSLSAQTCQNFDVLVSVDASDDDTAEVCFAYAKKDPRFKIFQQPHRLGWVGNSNFLLQQATADHVLFAFHDDILAVDYAEKLSALLDNHPETVLAYSDVALTHEDGEQEHWVYTALDGVLERTRRGLTLLKREGMWWVPNRGVFRLARARQIGGLKFHGAGGFSADWPWLLHMSLLGQFRRVPEVLCFKFYKPGSLSRRWEFSNQQWIEVAKSCLREIRNSELTTKEKDFLVRPLLDGLNRAFREGGPQR
jgi:glycosyltransferase involved in cell wall biosynthesis